MIYMEKVGQLRNKTKYTASVFKDVEFNYGVNFVSKELYDSIGKKDKVYGMELFEKADVKTAVELLKGMLKELDFKHDKLIDYCFPDLNTEKPPKTDQKMTEYKLLFCEECYQMTNHKFISLGNYKCMKCDVKPHKEAQMDYEEILKDNEERANECRKRFFEAESEARNTIT